VRTFNCRHRLLITGTPLQVWLSHTLSRTPTPLRRGCPRYTLSLTPFAHTLRSPSPEQPARAVGAAQLPSPRRLRVCGAV
jgi:hypothetical protein